MTLIHRHTLSSEYAELLSTSPSHDVKNRSKPTCSVNAESDAETATWHDALPSVDELQAVCRRLQADPEVSQRAIFNYCAPLFVFVCVLATCVGVLRLPAVNASALRVLDDFGNHKSEAVMAVFGLVTVIVGGLVCLRTTIWAVANVVRVFLEKDLSKPVDGSSDTFDMTQANVLFGGILT